MPRSRFAGAIPALMLACTLTGQARADMGPPAPSLDLTFLFEKLDQYPNHDFYLKYERGGAGNPRNLGPNLNKVEPGTPIHLGGSRRNAPGAVFLIAVPRGQALVLPEKADADWLRTAPAGGMQSQALPGDGAGAPLENYNGYDITYRVRIDGDRLEVDWVESNLNSWWSNARLIAILIAAACVLIPVAIVVLVVFLIVRSTRRTEERMRDEGKRSHKWVR